MSSIVQGSSQVNSQFDELVAGGSPGGPPDGVGQQRGLSTVHNVTLPDDERPQSVFGLLGDLAHVAKTYNPQGRIVPAEVVFYEGAGVATVKRSRVRGVDQVRARPKRGRVKLFSRKSRRRLLERVSRVRKDAKLPVFITLTYPNEFPRDALVWKAHLRAFLARLGRKFAKPGVFWRLEVVDRKSGSNAGALAPHYHLLVWGVPCSWEFKRWLSRAWFEVVGSGDERHLRAGTNAQVIRSRRQMLGYVSKALGRVVAGELAKDTQAAAAGVGRWWGYWFENNIPWGVRVVVTLTERQALTVIRYFRRFAGIKSRAYKSLTCFIDCDQWASNLGWVT